MDKFPTIASSLLRVATCTLGVLALVTALPLTGGAAQRPASRPGGSTATLTAYQAPRAAGVAHAASSDLGSQLSGGQTMYHGQYLQSPNGQYSLWMQDDGNLVEYNAATGKALWDPPPPNQAAGGNWSYAVLQTDGNFVIYPPGPVNHPARWASYTQGNPRDHLVLQDDGNLVIYSASGEPLWATMTADVPQGTPGSYNDYDSGQCTQFADEMAYDYTGRYMPNIMGNAGNWASSARSQRQPYATGPTPRIGSIAVFGPDVLGASSVGHVAWVTAVYPDRDEIWISDQNWDEHGGRRDSVPIYGVSTSGLQFIYLNP